MAYPRIFQRLFTDGGAGPMLRSDIIPQIGGGGALTFRALTIELEGGESVFDIESDTDLDTAEIDLDSVTGGTYVFKVDPKLASVNGVTINKDCEAVFVNPTEGNLAYSVSLIVKNEGHLVTWPSSIRWKNGQVPTLSTTGIEFLSFCFAGGIWYGSKESTFAPAS